MRINSQNNQFVFSLPQAYITKDIEEKFQILMEKNFVQYNDVMDYLNSTIKDMVFPSVSYEKAEQRLYHGKKKYYREAGNVADKFQGEIDITYRSVDSHMNYFLLLEICNRYYLQDNPNYLPTLNIKILDKDGDVIYIILLKDVIISSLSELRLAYYATDFAEQTFTLQFAYNFIDILWSIDREEIKEESIFDLPQTHDPRDVSGLEAEMIIRKKESENRIND
jgi:hypothetical protein